jgi:hypothetical protein
MLGDFNLLSRFICRSFSYVIICLHCWTVGDAGCISNFSFWGIGQDRHVSFKNFFLTFHNFLAGSPCFLLKTPSFNFLQNSRTSQKIPKRKSNKSPLKIVTQNPITKIQKAQNKRPSKLPRPHFGVLGKSALNNN